MPEYTSNQNGHRLSCWSRYDVGQYRPSSTDHWAKRRAQVIDNSGQQAGTFAPIRASQSPSFEHMLVEDLRMPGNNTAQPIRRLDREATKTSFNERARAGFQYWLIDRPKPTSFGKYGMGSYKTVLGIGNAPRS